MNTEKSVSLRESGVDNLIKIIVDLKMALADAKAELNLCRDELCLRCGDYKQRHLGACDGCRWKNV